jgi:uncharacterized protein (TIGR00730 family)
MEREEPVKKVCVFAGARGSSDLYPDADHIGYGLSQRGCHIFYGGSSKGIMGSLAKGAVRSGIGRITGVLPESIAALKHYDPAIDLIVKPDMPSRKAVFWECDAFLCLPGGFGTLDELFEIATEMKLGHADRRPVVVYNQGGFYDGLKLQLLRMGWAGTMPAERLNIIKMVKTVQEAIDAVTE